jgi:hypothetical protein
MKIKEITKMGWLGLLLLLPSCEKDVLGPDTGVGVPIEFSMSSAGYDEGDEVRSSGVMEPETKIIPLGEDNLYLYATLKEEPAEALRAEVGLQPNQKVQLAAYKSSTQQGTTLTYTYSGGKLTPDGGVRLKVEPDNSTYTFVAYSYYGDPTTAVNSLTGIDPGKDLVWGSKAQPVTTTESTQKVSIKMTHRFAQVRVKIDASTIATAITDIGTVTVLGGKTANLTEGTGDVAPTSTNANQTVDFPPSTSNVRTSTYCTYWQAVTGVSISSITLTTAGGDKTFSNLAVDFAKTLEAGKSYTLEVDLKRMIVAGSNIYWEETLNSGAGGLKFDEVGNSTYQGVFFKWGSLIGMSPVGDVADDVVLYIPPVSGGSWAARPVNSVSNTWGQTWASIPYVATTPVGTSQDTHYLYELGSSVYSSYTGDICSYLTEGVWRMPSAREFVGAIAGDYAWNEGSVSTDAVGKGIITTGLTYGSASLFFPASGYRTFITSELAQVGESIFFWTGSHATPNEYYPYSYCMRHISKLSVALNVVSDTRLLGFNVRCVKN